MRAPRSSVHSRRPEPRSAPEPARRGETLDHGTRGRVEPRFGHAFDRVRVHHDAEGASVAAAHAADAVTIGTDIFFAAEAYQPGTVAGDWLLAHELAHVVQHERFGPGDPARASAPGDASEREAGQAAAAVMGGGTAQVTTAPGAAAAREEMGFMERLGRTFSADSIGLLAGIPAAANDAALLRSVGETVQPGMLSGLGNELNLAKISPLLRFAGPLSLGFGLHDLAESRNGPQNLETMGGALASANSALSGGIGTLGLLGEGLTMAGGALEIGALGTAGGAASGAAAAAGPLGALAGSFAGGYEVGNLLNRHTTVSNHVTDYIGMTSELFGGDEGHNWLANRVDEASTDWAEGDYLGALGNGAAAAGATTLGTLGGTASWIGSSIADGASAVGSGISSAAGAVSDAAGDAYSWLDRGVRGLYGF